ncbi:MAG TPA: mechanosensitive ion channel family protein [Methylomirabilota bacterium]|nr:mechanosensitive ion channel family protein [Methylomirabilota bacterium]
MSPAVGRALTLAVTLALLIVGYRVVLGLIDRLVAAVAERHPDAIRSRTLGSLLTNLLRWVLAFVVLVLLLRELGIDVGALVVSAGVIGIVVGLGAQALIRDLITGIFLLFEGLLAIGDVVKVGDHTGVVEAIGLRVTRLRLPDGALRVVPNGLLTDFSNYSSGWARAIVDVAVPRTVDVERALAALRAIGEAWARDSSRALDPPMAQGIMRFSGGGDAVLRLTVKVEAARREETELELRRRIRDAFDREQWPVAGAS